MKRMMFMIAAITGVLTVPAAGAAVAGSAPVRTVSSPAYGASISVPASWQKTPYLGPASFGYDGRSGWVQLLAATEPHGLRQACMWIATGNVLHPYGLHPRIVFRVIAGRPGCLIYPSADAPLQPARAGGPVFYTSSALIAYRHPVRIDGFSYALLWIDADPGHLAAITTSLRLHQ